jgi:hypothetical protein
VPGTIVRVVSSKHWFAAQLGRRHPNACSGAGPVAARSATSPAALDQRSRPSADRARSILERLTPAIPEYGADAHHDRVGRTLAP